MTTPRPRVIARFAAVALALACGGDSTSAPSTTGSTPTNPGGGPTTPTTPTTPGTGPLTVAIISATSETSPANELPSEGMVVKVTDAQGAPAKGITLTWTPRDGGSVRAASPTDSLGRAAALWVLGPSAQPQTLTVSHAQIAKPAVFNGYVPIGSVTAVAPAAKKYVGDTLASYMAIRDTKGTLLTGAARVVVRDTTVARDAGAGTLLGRGDGATFVIVVSGPLNTPKDSVRVDFYRELHGAVWTYDDSPLPVLRAYSTNGAVTDSADVGANGRYSLKLSTHATGWATEVGIDYADQSARRFFPALMPVATNCVNAGVNCVGSDITADVSFVLVPRSYTVKRGKYAGRTLAVDLNVAMVTSVATGPSYLLVSGRDKASISATGAAPRLQSQYLFTESAWLADSFPIGVAVHRACCSTRAVVADDSVQLWRALDAIQSTLGMQIWVPVNDRPDYTIQNFQTPAAANRTLVFQFDTLVVTTGAATTFAMNSTAPLMLNDFVLSGWRGSAVDHVTAANILPQTQLLEYNPRAAGSLNHAVLVHEAMHTLGMGHGCQWASTQSYCGLATPDTLPSFEDAAYLMLAMDLKAATWKHRALHSLTAGLFGERAFMLHLDPIPAPWTLPDPSATGGADDIGRRRRVP